VNTQAEYISCVDKENRNLTRLQVAEVVALRVHEVIMTGQDGQPFVYIPRFFLSVGGMLRYTFFIRNGDTKLSTKTPKPGT
jgi:hypothetical protein